MSLLHKIGTATDVAMDVVVIGFLLTSTAHLSRRWFVAAIVIAMFVVLGKALRLTGVLRPKSRLESESAKDH